MKRGPKPEARATKVQRGTLQPCRDNGAVVELVTAVDPPMMPDYLSDAAKEVWIEQIGRVMLGGIGDRDSLLFARYCATEALARTAFAAGEPPPSAYLSELRRMEELLGIAGPRTRQTGKPGGATTIENPFARNGRRAA